MHLVNENHYTATAVYTHGSVQITGTMIFVLALIAEHEKDSDLLYVDRSERLVLALKDVEQKSKLRLVE